jgi:hypothetical protein
VLILSNRPSSIDDGILTLYEGEDHQLTKPVNQKDYTIRLRQFFDHHLQGKPAPEWLRGSGHPEPVDRVRERGK